MKKYLKYLIRWDLLVKNSYNKYLYYMRVKNSVDYWQSLKDKYKGQAGFVIGNGPSLKIKDLTNLHERGFISIASNKVYLAFEQTKWRPDFFTVADPLVWDKIKKNIHEDIEVVHIPHSLNDKDSKTKTIYWKSLKNDFTINIKNISDNLTKGACGGYTITYENIQLAIHLGLNPIYLIGCDHYYAGEKDVKPGKEIEQSHEKTHFIKGYREAGETVMAAPIELMTKSYEIARLYSDNKNVKIYNATRGGHLEVFERIDLDKVING